MRRFTLLLCGGLVTAVMGCRDGSDRSLFGPESSGPQGRPAFSTSGSTGGESSAGATVTTDKEDYAPGETVIITGASWWAGETVSLLIDEEPATHEPHLFYAVADEDGNFENRDFVIDDHDLGVTFTLTATGQSSGLTAQTTFTDGAPTNVSFTLNGTTFTFTGPGNPPADNPITVAPGELVTVTVTATTVNVPAGSATWKSTDVAVRGTATDPPDPNFGDTEVCDDTDVVSTSTLVTTSHSFTFEAPAVAKTYDVRVRPFQGDGCSGVSGSRTLIGVLIVQQVTANNPPDVTLTGDDTADEGDTKSYSFTTDDPDADDTFTLVNATCGANGNKSNETFNSATGAGSFDCTFPDGPATSTVSVTVSDGTDSDTDSIVVTVNNVAPTVSAITGLPTDPVPINTTVYGCVTFTDPAGALDEPYSAVFDWNVNLWDEVGPLTSNAGPFAYGDQVCSSHTYTAAGVYAVQVGVTDEDGGTGYSPVYEYVVVYDPDAGFVTGGGWIWSPAGAYAYGPELEGKASFGFVSRYQRGATVPTGQTQFQFHAGSLSFHSSSYDWLVVSGARAQYKGYGAVNGVLGYQFMLTAIDGDVSGGGGVDKFRIKIWNDYGTLYDNQMGDADDGEVTTEIRGGSIVIHTGGKKK